MHEWSLMKGLIHNIESSARAHSGERVRELTLRVGALCPVSVSALLEGFSLASVGTPAEGAKLNMEVLSDPCDSHAQEVLLGVIEWEEKG